jgi:hypothetical protein
VDQRAQTGKLQHLKHLQRAERDQETAPTFSSWRHRTRTAFAGGLLSRASVRKVHEAMEGLARQFDELVAQDLQLPTQERHGVSLFVGLRPWEYSEFSKLRRKPREVFF